tara:strand:- start:1834 stop:1947 length:114 start_codon:yes stop_codon:yes gene_type:complete
MNIFYQIHFGPITQGLIAGVIILTQIILTAVSLKAIL